MGESENPVADWVLKQIEAHGPKFLLFPASCLIALGGVIGWWLKAIRQNAEIAQIREEVRKTAGENLAELNRLRDAKDSKAQVLHMAMQNMRDALIRKDNTDAVRSCRDEMCSIYSSEYMPALAGYLESVSRLADRREAAVRAQTELVPDLKSICKFLAMSNLPEMLEKVPGSKPYRLDRARRDGLFFRVKALVPFWRLDLRLKIRKFRKRTDEYLRPDSEK